MRGVVMWISWFGCWGRLDAYGVCLASCWQIKYRINLSDINAMSILDVTSYNFFYVVEFREADKWLNGIFLDTINEIIKLLN